MYIYNRCASLFYSSSLCLSFFAVFLSSKYSWFGDLALDSVSVNNLVKTTKEGDEGLDVTLNSVEQLLCKFIS